MRMTKLVLACCLLATTAYAQPAPDGGTPPVQPLGGDGSGSAAPLGSEQPQTQPPPPPPEPTPPPQPTPPPTPAPAPAPAPAPTPPAPPPKEEKHEEPSRPRCEAESREYYSCEHGYGIFHSSRMVIGMASAKVPTPMTDPMTGNTSSMDLKKTGGVFAFEGSFLPMRSSFSSTNFHGLEFSTGIRTSKFDFWLSFGTSVTLLNLGHGGPGTLRLGGGFGAGFDLAHGYGYIRGRGALVLVPEKVDIELSTQYTPTSASTDNYEARYTRFSLWWRFKGSRKALELYAAGVKRVDASRPMDDRALIGGNELGIGISMF